MTFLFYKNKRKKVITKLLAGIISGRGIIWGPFICRPGAMASCLPPLIQACHHIRWDVPNVQYLDESVFPEIFLFLFVNFIQLFVEFCSVPLLPRVGKLRDLQAGTLASTVRGQFFFSIWNILSFIYTFCLYFWQSENGRVYKSNLFYIRTGLQGQLIHFDFQSDLLQNFVPCQKHITIVISSATNNTSL